MSSMILMATPNVRTPMTALVTNFLYTSGNSYAIEDVQTLDWPYELMSHTDLADCLRFVLLGARRAVRDAGAAIGFFLVEQEILNRAGSSAVQAHRIWLLAASDAQAPVHISSTEDWLDQSIVPRFGEVSMEVLSQMRKGAGKLPHQVWELTTLLTMRIRTLIDVHGSYIVAPLH